MKLTASLLRLLAPIAAVVFALLVSSLALLLSGNPPIEAFSSMLEYGTRLESVVSTINRAVPLYLAGLAVAIGLRMNLFNIGVEGQYRFAALIAAAVGGALNLPPVLHVGAIMITAIVVGSAWASIAGILKVTRGVHEVISTIMLNTIGVGLSAYLLGNYLADESDETSLNIQTPPIPESGLIPNLNGPLEAVTRELKSGTELQGFVLIAMVIGLLYYLLISRTTFGFDLRASGINPFAAEASGVAPRRMILISMLLSGAVAGLVGIGPMLGFFGDYSLDFPTGLGFTGIAVALVGRYHPVGVAIGALLFGFLERSSQILDLDGIPKEIVTIMQGIILLSIVVAYEVVNRAVQAREVKAAAEATAGAATAGPGAAGAAGA